VAQLTINQRVDLFLRLLRLTGNALLAARQASPRCTGLRPGMSTFKRRRDRSPEFRARWDAALTLYHQNAEAEALRLAEQR